VEDLCTFKVISPSGFWIRVIKDRF